MYAQVAMTWGRLGGRVLHVLFEVKRTRVLLVLRRAAHRRRTIPRTCMRNAFRFWRQKMCERREMLYLWQLTTGHDDFQ